MKRFAEVHRRARPLAVNRQIDAVVSQDTDQQIDVGEVWNIFER